MIVQRITWNVKVGCADKCVELLKAECAKWKVKWRIYTPNIAKMDKVAGETEFESLAELEKFWTEWFASPGTAEFWKKYNELVDTGGTNETWNLM
jgi:hypothetical protein